MNLDFTSISGAEADQSATAAGTVPPPEVDASTWRELHLIGIGGAGMSGIARLLLARGIAVSGSDLKDSETLQRLRELGATADVGHRPEQVGQPDAVVVSSAIPAANVEVQRARADGIPVLSRAQVLAALMRGRRAIAVSGTHGKTTTTSMISVVLSRLGLDPSFVIGGDLNESGSGAGHGGGDLFVAEADESDGSFLLYRPAVAVITNVEEDHLDFYRDREEIERAFRAFAERASVVVACWDDPGVRQALDGFSGRLVRYGSSPDAEVALDGARADVGGARAMVRVGGPTGPSTEIQLSIPGSHNLLNAAAVIAVASVLGLPVAEAAAALASFSGVRRRFEHRGLAGGAMFVDDYAHHPTEVRATIRSAIGLRDLSSDRRRVVAVFQPHRYTRTRAMWRDLGESLEDADLVVFTDVYGAGERPMPGVTGKLLVEALAEHAPGKRVVYVPRRSDVARFLAGEVREGDLVLTLGAGDITMVPDETLERIREGRRQ
jgi:UDP-N-acetylmuramate--alanine ligase